MLVSQWHTHTLLGPYGWIPLPCYVIRQRGAQLSSGAARRHSATGPKPTTWLQPYNPFNSYLRKNPRSGSTLSAVADRTSLLRVNRTGGNLSGKLDLQRGHLIREISSVRCRSEDEQRSTPGSGQRRNLVLFTVIHVVACFIHFDAFPTVLRVNCHVSTCTRT